MNKKGSLWLLVALVLGAAIFIAGCGAGGTAGSSAENYPTKPITIVSWSSPGAGTDVLARQAAPFLEEELGQPVSVQNITGGSGAVAMQEMLSKPADGHMIGVNTRSQMVSMNTELEGRFSLEDFAFLAMMQGDPYVLAVKADSGIENLDDYVSAVKSNDRASIGGFGANSAHSLYVASLSEQLGIEPEYIPFEGGSDVVTALLGDNVDAALTNAGQVMEQVEAGEIRVLGVSTEERMEQLQDTPTFTELDLDDNLNVTHWRGFYAKAGTPPGVVEKLDAAFEKLSTQDDWHESLDSSGLTNDFMPSAEFTQFVQEDFEEIGAQLEGGS